MIEMTIYFLIELFKKEETIIYYQLQNKFINQMSPIRYYKIVKYVLRIAFGYPV